VNNRKEYPGPAPGRKNQLYSFGWGNNPKRADLKGRTCRVLAVGKRGSCMVRFMDTGEIEIVSRRALRRMSCE